MNVVAGASDQTFFDLEAAQRARIHESNEFLHLGHHLGTDPVAGEKKKLVVGHRALPRVNAY
jgi:hypothetical protein